MDRIDVLGSSSRADLFSGSLLGDTEDEELQRLVSQAASELHAPIGLVSLVLDRTQFFRAHCGLPPDLAAARATDRDVSFCQLVVRDEAPLSVERADADQRVPQALVDAYGIGAYLGVPVRSGGRVLGSLCVIDVEPRTFDDNDREIMTELSHRVSMRLEQLSRMTPTRRMALFTQACRPAFSEMRNVLSPLKANLHVAQLAAAEAAPLARLVGTGEGDGAPAALSVLEGARTALLEVQESINDLSGLVERLEETMTAIQDATQASSNYARLHDVVRRADTIAHHATKVAGGVRWPKLPADDHVHGQGVVLVSTLAAVLAAIANDTTESMSGIDVTLESRDEGLELMLETNADASITAEIRQWVSDEEAVSVAHEANRVVVTFTHHRMPRRSASAG